MNKSKIVPALVGAAAASSLVFLLVPVGMGVVSQWAHGLSPDQSILVRISLGLVAAIAVLTGLALRRYCAYRSEA